MSWSQSLIKLATYEVETLQKRLSEVQDRRQQLETRQTLMAAEAEAEMAQAAGCAHQSHQLAAYLVGLRHRRALLADQLAAVALEEQGARDALTRAYEEQKKYEQVAETARRLQAVEAGRREAAAFDELGLRKAAR